MSYLIRITSDECPPRFFQRFNGFVPPSLTPSSNLAKKMSLSEAESALEKVKSFIAKEKGGETVTAELVEASDSSVADASVSPDKGHPDYIEGWGKPRAKFIFAGHERKFYMKKSGNGRILYAYNIDGGAFVTENEDGEAVFRAFCVSCCDWGVAKIRKFKEKNNG